MPWLNDVLDLLAKEPACGYAPATAPATEPTALAALALHANGRGDNAQPSLDWLASIQAGDGSVGVRDGEVTPGWPTSLAVVAWHVAGAKQYGSQIDSAVRWILTARGETLERSSEFGHDTQIAGWSYAERTHSWIEPTALHVVALKATGQSRHERTRDGVRLLIDRLLASGGCNYGNTVVLGQTLRPHVQPTGIALLALAGEADASGRIGRSVDWLQRSLGPQTTAASLSWGLLGLHAHGIETREADEWLGIAQARVMRHDRSPHKLALLSLAAKGWPR